MVSPNSMSDHEGLKSSSSSKSLAAELYGTRAWKGKIGSSTVVDDKVPDERSEEATLSPVATKLVSSVSTSFGADKEDPRLALPLKAPRSMRVSEYFPPGRVGIPRLIAPPKAPLKPKGNIPSLVRTKSGSSDNPIDIDAMHPTWDRLVKNPHMVKGTRLAIGSRLGVRRVLKAAPKVQKPVRLSSSLHRSILTEPATGPTYHYSRAAFPIAAGSYHAAGQNVQKLQSLLDTQTSGRMAYSSLPTTSYQQHAAPYGSSHILHQSHLPVQFPLDARYSHYPVDPRQYPPMPYPISQPEKTHPKHTPQPALTPIEYAKSRYHQPLAPYIHSLPGHEACLRQRAVQYVSEYSRPHHRKRGVFEDPEATSNSEYESGISSQHTINKFTDQMLRAEYRPQVLASEIKSSGSYAQHAAAYGANNLDLEALMAHTQLLTNMFDVYPQSRDQAGLRKDMEMLISIQNQRFHDWVASEKAERTRKQAKLFNGDLDSNRMVYAFMKGGRGGDETETEDKDKVAEGKEKTRTEKEEEVLKTIDSTAEIWEKNRGLGIVDIFANGEGGGSRIVSEGEDVDSVLGSDVDSVLGSDG